MNKIMMNFARSNIQATVTQVSPLMAEQMLRSNTNNRNLSQGKVNLYAKDMVEGRWVLNGESIKFDTNGKMLDGQHRLQAVILSGRTVEMLIVSNVEPVAMQTIDTGMVRSAGQILRMAGVNNPNDIAALASTIYVYKTSPHLVWTGNRNITKSEITNLVIENNPRLQEAVHLASAAYRAARVHRIAYGLLAYEAIEKHKTDIELWNVWHQGIIDGVGFQHGDSRLTLRNYMLKRNGKGGGYTIQQEQAAYVIKAWNAYVAGVPLKILRWNKTMLPMPEIA